MIDTHAEAGVAVRFARSVLLIAGVVGLIELTPLYFYESTLGRTNPPPLTHPDFYYGFIGVAIAWQVAFIIMSRDPVRYRPLFPALFLEKLLYPLCTYVLYAAGRVNPSTLAVSSLDLVWLALFVAVWLRLGRVSPDAAR